MVTYFSLILSSAAWYPGLSAAETIEYKYHFKNVGLDGAPGTPSGFVLTGASSDTVPRVIKQSYGVRLETNPLNEYNNRSFHIPVPTPGTYQVLFSGFTASSGGLGKLEMNDEFIGNYNFYAASSQAGPTVELNKINLTAGTHTVTFTTISNSAGTPYMFPTELILRKMPSELAHITLDRDAGTTFSAVLSVTVAQ
ncbi:hypothetical protein M6D81_09170 [Paenibacillus sp. J5C_2022]|uniref:hypothetical protein n=1 Tax=Paenibacillus sp. J5C2022 TaxID=2977129 RepID=UPI0021CE7258|nr:hypothetical protein [Paenibacillus sp. J5C2022]MCU6708890.1 hypothetical protein [Paenibacillus sp. J5C2022]